MLRDTVYISLLTARKAKDDVAKLNTLIMLWAAIQNKEKETKVEKLSDEDVLTLIRKSIKDNKETIEGFSKRGDHGNVVLLRYQNRVLEEYLPKQLTDDEISAEISEFVVSQGEGYLEKFKAPGQMMKDVMPLFKGRADGAKVKVAVENLFKQQRES